MNDTPHTVEHITRHLNAYRDGDELALHHVLEGMYEQLCRLANNQLFKYNQKTASGTELVHELYLKFASAAQLNAENRQHFLAISATAMRQLILDQIKAKGRLKRGGDLLHTTLSKAAATWADNRMEIIAVDRAVKKLAEIEPVLAATVECKYFAGYSDAETAEALGVTERSVRRYWQRARKWLALEIRGQ